MKKYFLTLLIYLTTSLVYAYDQERASENFADELIACGAYYSIISSGYLKTDPKEAMEYRDTVTLLLLLATEHSRQKIEAIEATFRLFHAEQLKEIDNDLTNISILLEKHAYQCKGILENPEDRLNYWLSKKG